MVSEDSSGRKGPTVLRIKLRYDDIDTFVEKFAPNIGRAGLFIRSRTPKPVGSEVRFELRLADETPVVVGLGVVRWIREYDPRRPRAVHGMGIEFMRVTRESRDVLLRVLEHRRKVGLADPGGIPVPPDDDTAVTEPPSPPPPAAVAAAAAVAAPAPTPAPVETPVPEASLDSSASRPTPLPPREPRRPRVNPVELVAQARNGKRGDDVAIESFVHDGLDVAGALARARAITGSGGSRGGDADSALHALLEESAAPQEVTIDDASARLAALLGGPAVVARRRRNSSGAHAALAEGTAVAAPAPQPVPAPEPAPAPEPESPPAPAPAPEPDAEPSAAELATGDSTAVTIMPAGRATTRDGEDDDDDAPETELYLSPPAEAPAPADVPDGIADLDTEIRSRADVRRSSPPPPGLRPGRGPLPPLRREESGSITLDVGPGRLTSSGSIDITELVAQLEGDALDADRLLGSDLGRAPRRRPPTAPQPGLASFADPPEHDSRRPGAARASTVDDLEQALDSLDLDDIGTGAPPAAPKRAPTDDGIEIDLDLDGIEEE